MGEFNKDSTILSGYQILDRLRLSVLSPRAIAKRLDSSLRSESRETKGSERQEGTANALQNFLCFRPLDYTSGDDGKGNRMA